MDESINQDPVVIKGPVIDLFDPQLPVLKTATISSGQQGLLYNLARVTNKSRPQVLASASRIYNETVKPNEYSFVSKSPLHTTNSVRILLPSKVKHVLLTDNKGNKLKDITSSWDESSHTCYLSFENSPDGTNVTVNW